VNAPRTIRLLEGANRDCIDTAWGIIANAHGGDFSEADPEWVDAVRRWEREWKPYSESTLSEAAFDRKDMERRMANLRARRDPEGLGDSVMSALDRGELPSWDEPRHPAIVANFSTF